jgi:hypothetical protein
MSQRKYYVLHNPDGYHLALDEADTFEEAEIMCLEFVENEDDTPKIIYGRELTLTPVEVVKTWKLVDPEHGD